MNQKNWERYGFKVHRMKVDGGYLYSHDVEDAGNCMVFVPDVDLQRYQAHLRDAYKQGYADGQQDLKDGVQNPEESPYHAMLREDAC